MEFFRNLVALFYAEIFSSTHTENISTTLRDTKPLTERSVHNIFFKKKICRGCWF